MVLNEHEMTNWFQNSIHWWLTFPPKNYLGGQLSYKNGFNINYSSIIYLISVLPITPIILEVCREQSPAAASAEF